LALGIPAAVSYAKNCDRSVLGLDTAEDVLEQVVGRFDDESDVA
jgi:hypothetical protein